MVVVVLPDPFPRDGGLVELHGDPTVGPCLKVWTRGQKWKCQRWSAGEARMRDNPDQEEVSQIL